MTDAPTPLPSALAATSPAVVPTADGPDLPVAEAGVIRGAQAVVRLDRPLPDGWRFGLEGTYRVEGRKARTRLLWAANPTPKGALAVDLPPEWIEGGSTLLQGLLPVAAPASGEVARLRAGPSYQIGLLLPLKAADTKRLIFDKTTRPGDLGTLEFVMNQVLRSPLNRPVDRIEAVKVLAYRALESGDPDRMVPALGLVERGLEQAELMTAAFGPDKDNRYNARMSLWYVKANLCFFAGDVTGCRRALEVIRADLGFLDRAPLVANNSSLGLTVLGYVKLCQGDPVGAVETWSDVVALFRAAAQHFPASPPKMFGELSVCFGAARFCVCAIDAVRKGRPELHADLNPSFVALNFLRLRKGQGAERAEAVFEALRREAGEGLRVTYREALAALPRAPEPPPERPGWRTMGRWLAARLRRPAGRGPSRWGRSR